MRLVLKRVMLAVLLALAVITVIASLVYVYVVPYCIAEKQAYEVFASSRAGDPRSYEFVAHGIRYGMTHEEVRNVMPNPHRVLEQMPLNVPRWEGTVDLYIFRYGPTWKVPFRKERRVLCEEWYWVYFSSNGGAAKLERDMVKGNGDDVTVDLKARTMKNKGN